MVPSSPAPMTSRTITELSAFTTDFYVLQAKAWEALDALSDLSNSRCSRQGLSIELSTSINQRQQYDYHPGISEQASPCREPIYTQPWRSISTAVLNQ